MYWGDWEFCCHVETNQRGAKTTTNQEKQGEQEKENRK